MASAELSRRVENVVGYPPLVEMDDRQRREFHEALLDADSFEGPVPALFMGGRAPPNRTLDPAGLSRARTSRIGVRPNKRGMRRFAASAKEISHDQWSQYRIAKPNSLCEFCKTLGGVYRGSPA